MIYEPFRHESNLWQLKMDNNCFQIYYSDDTI